ncbi:MAG: stage II sporulation protein M [Candidatus Nanohaloarchaea archaeon]
MLPELILREEEHENLPLLALLGLLSGLLGFAAAKMLFPSQADLLGVIFASIPLIFPLTSYFLERENETAPHLPEVEVYGSVFFGEVVAFFLLGMYFQDAFSLQNQVIGATGNAVNAVSFTAILSNNLMVFLGILAVASVIGSAGAFVLTWNASVLGVFFADLFRESAVKPLAYVPHATFEMGGFIIAGISGSMISAALYREHFERDTWIDIAELVAAGLLLILFGAFLETA